MTVRFSEWLRLSVSYGLLVLAAFLIRVLPGPVTSYSRFFLSVGFPSSEAAFLSLFSLGFTLGLAILLVLCLLALADRKTDWRTLFTLQSTDWPGFFALFAIGAVVATLEAVGLRTLVFNPVQTWLIRCGARSEIQLPLPPLSYFYLNLGVFLAVSWVEMVEEVYFRGYLQPVLVRRLGPWRGIFLALLLWDLWHLWNPAMLLRRFVINLPSAILVHLRGRVWCSMLAHPLGNRLGTLLWLLSGGPA
jgi:membrane protease YdiL (CAAX protease family)